MEWLAREHCMAKEKGGLADLAVLGLPAFGAKMPFSPSTRPVLVPAGSDFLFIELRADGYLDLEFVEGNYSRDQHTSWTRYQERFLNAIQQGKVRVRVWEHVIGGPNASRWRRAA